MKFLARILVVLGFIMITLIGQRSSSSEGCNLSVPLDQRFAEFLSTLKEVDGPASGYYQIRNVQYWVNLQDHFQKRSGDDEKIRNPSRQIETQIDYDSEGHPTPKVSCMMVMAKMQDPVLVFTATSWPVPLELLANKNEVQVPVGGRFLFDVNVSTDQTKSKAKLRVRVQELTEPLSRYRFYADPSRPGKIVLALIDKTPLKDQGENLEKTEVIFIELERTGDASDLNLPSKQELARCEEFTAIQQEYKEQGAQVPLVKLPEALYVLSGIKHTIIRDSSNRGAVEFALVDGKLKVVNHCSEGEIPFQSVLTFFDRWSRNSTSYKDNVADLFELSESHILGLSVEQEIKEVLEGAMPRRSAQLILALSDQTHARSTSVTPEEWIKSELPQILNSPTGKVDPQGIVLKRVAYFGLLTPNRGFVHKITAKRKNGQSETLQLLYRERPRDQK